MSARKSRLREAAYTLFFMAALSSGLIALTSGTYLLTRDRVVRNENLYMMRAVLSAAEVALPEDPAEVERLYERRVREIDRHYEVIGEDGEVTGYVFVESGAGLWGSVLAAVGLEPGRDRILGVEFIEHNETPGLGGRIEEEWFRRQFRGKTGPLEAVGEGEPTGEREFEAITGATVTTRAVRRILNGALERAGGGR